MALSFGTNDPLTIKRWAKALERETLPATIASLLVGKNRSMSPLTLEEDLQKSAGDRLRLPYLHLSNQAPIKTVSIDGNEHSPEYSHDDLLIDKESYAERRETTMNDQRTEFNFREDMKYLLSSRWTESMEISILNQLAGNSTGLSHDGTPGFDANNPITEPTATHRIFSGGAANEGALGAGDVLSSEDIKAAASLAETLRTQFGLPIIKRANLPGVKAPMWGLIISPRQRDHLINETATQGSFFDVQRAAMEGGETSDSQTILRSRYVNTTYQYIGQYAGVAIYVDPYTPFGNDGAGALLPDVDRSIFFGAGAGAIGFGRKTPGLGRYEWLEETFRYNEEYGVAARCVWGATKRVIDGNDLGVIVISSHGEAA